MDNKDFKINTPESYGDRDKVKNSSLPQIDKVPLATNKVRKLVIRGTLKNDTSSD